MWTGFKRIIRAGCVGFWRNAFVSLASIFVMTVVLFVIGSTLLLNQLLAASLENIKDKVDINVYFVTSAEEADIEELRDAITALPEVAEVGYTSREQALNEFRERHQNDELTIQALDELSDNPLGASLSIQAHETGQYESIAQFLREQQASETADAPLIDRINFFDNQTAINRLTTIIDAVERSSLIAMSILVAAAVLITFNTIRLAIYTTREEISVMRLVGASNMFIRGPFMLQGIMYGLISGALALLIIYPIVLWLGSQTDAFFGFNIFAYFVSEFVYLVSVIVGAGVLLGLISSVLAVSRYLRV